MNIVTLSIRASNLPDASKLPSPDSHSSRPPSPSSPCSCPFAVVTLLSDDREPTILGKTEVIENSVDPDWKNTFLINYEDRSKATYILVKIFHEVHQQQNEMGVGTGSFKELGSGVFELKNILQSEDGVGRKMLKRQGSIEVRAETFVGQSWLKLKMKGASFKNTRGFMKKLTPFYQFSKVDVHERGDNKLCTVHKSDKTQRSSLRPDWAEETIDIDRLCDNDLNLPLCLSIYHHRSNGNHELLGEIQTCVNDIISAKKLKSTLEMKKDGAVTGSIIVEEASMSGIEDGKYFLQNVIIFTERKLSSGVEVALNKKEENSSLVKSIHQRNQTTICV